MELFGWKPAFGTYELINKRLKTKIRPKKFEKINMKILTKSWNATKEVFGGTITIKI